MDVQTFILAGGSLIGAVVWFVRLEGRVNSHDKELIAAAKRSDELREDVQYIRERIDAALNGRPDHK